MTVIGVDLIQSEGTRGGRGMCLHPGEGTLLSVMEDIGDGGEGDALRRERLEAGLDAAGGGMGMDEEGQEVAGEGEGGARRMSRRRGRVEEEVQGVVSLVTPGVEGGARNVKVTGEGRHEAVLAATSEHGGGALNALVRRARMGMTHGVLPGGELVVTRQRYTRELACAEGQTVKKNPLL